MNLRRVPRNEKPTTDVTAPGGQNVIASKQDASLKLLQLEAWRGTDTFFCAFDHLTAWEQEPSDDNRHIPRGFGVRVYLRGGQQVELPRVAFSTITDLLKKELGDRFDEMFAGTSSGRPMFVRVDHISGWEVVSNRRQLYTVCGHTISTNMDFAGIAKKMSPSRDPLYAKQDDLGGAEDR